MYRLTIRSAFILFFVFFSGQKVNSQFILTNVNKMNSIDWENFNYAQLKPFNEALETNDILILAESNHGHLKSYDAQCMILKGLIDSSKITSLYIESNWMNCDKIMDLLTKKGLDAIKESEKFMHSVELKYWVSNGFWNYLAKKIIEGKIRLYGFDIEGISPIIMGNLFENAKKLQVAKEYFKENDESYNRIKWYFENFAGWGPSSVLVEKNYSEISKFIQHISKHYLSQKLDYEAKQWESVQNYFYWVYKRSSVLSDNKYKNQITNNKQSSAFDAIRDSLMASIFLKSYSQSPGEKIVCSMSSYHALRNSNLIENISDCCKDPSVRTMLEIIDEKTNCGIYNVCFISASGEYGIQHYQQKWKKILKPAKNSMEYSLNKNGYELCFLNLVNTEYKKSVFYMNAVFNKYLSSNWSKNFSGIFFIRNMEPVIFNK